MDSLPERPLDAQELRESFEGFTISFESIDPKATDVERYIQSHAEDIYKRIRGDAAAWGKAHDLWFRHGKLNAGFAYDFTLDEMSVRVSMHMRGGKLDTHVSVHSAEWYQRRTTEMRELFGKRDVVTNRGAFCSVDQLGCSMAVHPMKEFVKKQQFDPSGIVDALDQGLDTNVIELVRLLNEIGIHTKSSCGGHAEDGRMPYLHVSSETMKEAVSLFLSWKDAGGLPYVVMPLGQLVTSIRIEPPPGTSLQAAQADLDKLTDFLSSKAGATPFHRLSFGEMRHRIGRSVRGWFGENA